MLCITRKCFDKKGNLLLIFLKVVYWTTGPNLDWSSLEKEGQINRRLKEIE